MLRFEYFHKNNITSLIIDERFNTGGKLTLSQYLAGYFFSERTQVFTVSATDGEGFTLSPPPRHIHRPEVSGCQA